MVEVNLFGATRAPMTAIFNRTISMELVSTNGPTVEFLREIGSTIVWKAKVSFPGVTVGNTSASIKTIKNTVKEPLRGLMVDAIKVSGTRVSSTGRVSTSKKAKSAMVCGKWEKE